MDVVRALLVGLALTLPFFALEYAHSGAEARQALIVGLPGRAGVLWGVLWLLPAALTAIVLPTVRAVRGRRGVARHPVLVVLMGVLLAAIATIWVAIIVDQMPCFLGVPNCD
jgi:hypothetical protein